MRLARGSDLALLFWTFVLLPTALVGLAGIMEAFRRDRQAARRCAIIAGVPALALFAWLTWEVWSNPQCLGEDCYLACLGLGLVSFTTAF